MAFLDDYIEPMITEMVVVNENDEVPNDYVCDFSMKIELKNATLKHEKNILKALVMMPVIKGCSMRKDSDIRIKYLFLKLQLGIRKRAYRRLTQTILQCLTIDGDSDSFAIVSFFKGNCMSESTSKIYEDFVTPTYTIDNYKFQTFINEIITL